MDSRKIKKLAQNHGLPGFGNSEVASIEITSVTMTIINLGQYFF